MSYDFRMMKPKAAAAIHTHADLNEDTLVQQDGATVVGALSVLFPTLRWRREDDGGWFGSLDAEDTWYEFRIDAQSDYIWSVYASHRAATRSLIPKICAALDVIAFDGQAMVLIRP